METFIKEASLKNAVQLFKCTLLAAALVGTATAANAAELTVTVSNIKQATGSLYIRVYDAESQWLSQDEKGPRATEVIDLSVTDITENNPGEITRTFDLPEGTYAAATVHDVNKNGTLDTDWRGVPKEPTGTSGFGENKKGPPEFEMSKFELGSEGTAERIRLSEY